jgi:hypothetical protein
VTNRSRPAFASFSSPAWCAVSALNENLRNFSAVGLIAFSSAAHAFAVLMSSSGGTTAFTSPQSRAWAAEYWRQKNQISRARFCPTTRAR